MMEMMRYGFNDWVQHIKPEAGQKSTPLGFSADDCRGCPVVKYTPTDVLRFRSSDVAHTYWKMSMESRAALSVYLGARSQDKRDMVLDDWLTANHDVVAAENCLEIYTFCLLYTSPSPRDRQKSRMPSSA